MNRQFMIKMLQAKQMEYEALKEIMPEPMAKRMSKIESELMEFGKEYFMTVMCSDKKDNPDPNADTKVKSRKVTIE